MNARKILGELLSERTPLTAPQLTAALDEQSKTGRRLGETLVDGGVLDGEQVAEALAAQLGLEYAPPPLTPAAEVLALVDLDLVRARQVLPLRAPGKTLVLAMANPLDLETMDDLRFQTGRRIEPAVASLESIEAALPCEGSDTDIEALVDALPPELRGSSPTDSIEALVDATRSVPVVRLVDSLIERALDSGASDIHVEETGADVQVRYRVDGVLRRALDLPAAARRAVLSRIKVMADMDIAVRRRAQDGRIPIDRGGRNLTLRVSTLPVNGGEKAVLRILDSGSAPRDLDRLGLARRDMKALRGLLHSGEGVILVAGPTGSGKSTTIFAALSELDRDRHNVVTLEDPVEYRLPGANQVQVDPRSGLDFAAALRAVLRQDPDIVMVGEIRDRETAEIAMAAAVTGHLVLSTIHTTDAPGAVTRLLNMGVPPFLVAGGLSGVLAQRLVRKVCAVCRGRSCDECGDGHSGRTGVFQLLTVTDALRDAVSRGESSGRIRVLAEEAGMGTLAGDARRALADGLTSPHEISRLVRSGGSSSLPCPSCDGAVPLGAVACPSCGSHRRRLCACGRTIESGWRYCPWCVRPAAA